jgi:hypothetical protein
MFGFGKSKYKGAAAEQIGTSLEHAYLFLMPGQVERLGLQGLAERMPVFKPESGIRLLAVAQLSHNLMLVALQYSVANPKGLEKEFLPVKDFIYLMLPQYRELGHLALLNLRELESCFDVPENLMLFPRRGWGRWVVNNLKRELTGQPQNPNAALSTDEKTLANAIDDHITRPFAAQFGMFYKRCDGSAYQSTGA